MPAIDRFDLFKALQSQLNDEQLNRVISSIPNAASNVPFSVSMSAKVTNLIDWAETVEGPGLEGLLNTVVKHFPKFSLTQSVENTPTPTAKEEKASYVRSLRITNLKCFQGVNVELNYPQKETFASSRLANINLFLGENGVGKTTVCQALCIGVLQSILALSGTGFRSSGLVRLGTDIATIGVDLVLGTSGTTGIAFASISKVADTEFLQTQTLPYWAQSLFEEDSPDLFLVAYGANRRTERPEAYNDRLRTLRYQRVASLFEPHIGLLPLSLALEYSKGRREELVKVVNALLPPEVQLLHSTGEPLFKAFGVSLPLSGLSDGYRLHVSWVVDFISQLARVLPANQPLREAKGIVIVDEIDLLLHPSWQRHVVPTLSETFPNIQFLLTTHSPIVAGTLESKNLFLIESTPSVSDPSVYQSSIRPCTESTLGLSIDTILVRLFGLESPRAPYLETQLSALEQKARNGDKQAAIEYLRRLRIGSESK